MRQKVFDDDMEEEIDVFDLKVRQVFELVFCFYFVDGFS